jgi:hypothetical protein
MEASSPSYLERHAVTHDIHCLVADASCPDGLNGITVRSLDVEDDEDQQLDLKSVVLFMQDAQKAPDTAGLVHCQILE